MPKQLHLGLFDAANLNKFGTVTWRHPDSEAHRFADVAYWTELAGLLEDACFDFIFFADNWGYSEVSGARQDIAFLEGLDVPRLDPAIVAASLAPVTKRIGVVLTLATLLEQPYASARRLSSLDHLLQGRLGWNVVTAGFTDTSSALFGVEMLPHDERYDMADEFMELVYKVLEGSWEPDAVVGDKAWGFVDPRKVHRVAHEGRYFTSHGFGNTPYSPQGTPTLFQAGSSRRGLEFGASHAECTFLQGTTPARVKQAVANVRAAASAKGRDPMSVKNVVGLSVVVAPTREEAERKYEEYVELQTPEVAIASYSMFTGIDLSIYPPDTLMDTLSTELGQSQLDRFKGWTVRDVVEDFRRRGVRGFKAVGSPEDVADEMCALADEADIDGYLLEPWVQPTSTVDFVEQVLPILRKRGFFREEYQEDTLRERLQGPGQARLRGDHPGSAFRPEGQA